MHKTGIGLMSLMAIGMMLSSIAAAEDRAQPVVNPPATTQTSSDGASATQQSTAGQGQDAAQGASAPAQAPVPADNAAPATPPTAAAPSSEPAKKPTADKPAADQPAAEKPAADKPAADKPAADKPAADKPATNKPTAEKPAPAKKASPADKAAKSDTAPALAANEKASKSQPGKTYKVPACHDLNAPQVAELIKQDYTQNRFPHTDDDKKALGGDTIVADVNPEDITGTGDNWQAPLKIRGQTADRAYTVNLDCEKGEISYSLQR